MKECRKHRWQAVVAAVLILTLLLLSGCATKKKVEWREVHDTIHVTHSDTTYITRHVADTVRMKDSVLVTLRESGDTVRVEVWRDRWRESVKTDTVMKTKTDTVYKVQVAEHEREVVKSPWGIPFAWRLLILLAIAAAVWWWLQQRNK